MQSRSSSAAPLFAAALLLCGSAWADGRPDKSGAKPVAAAAREHAPSLDEARAMAQRARRTLVLEFGARWCGPCKEFDLRVLPHPAVQRSLTAVMFVHYDAEEAPGQAAARAFKVAGYPTFVALGQDGRVIDRLEGFRGPREFSQWLERIALDFESDESLQVRLGRAPGDAEALLVLGRRQAQRGQDAEAEATLARAVAAAGTAKPKSDGLAAAADWELRIVRLRRFLREAPRKEMAEHLLAFPQSRNADAAFHELTRRGPAVDPLALRAVEQYVDVRIASLSREKGQGPSDAKAPDALNEAVYACLRIGAYAAAERAAQKLLSLDDKNPLYLDTLAEVQHLRGDRAQALSLSTRALAAAERQGAEGKELRAVLLKNQARFARAAHELPAELLSEEEEALSPWERPVELHR